VSNSDRVWLVRYGLFVALPVAVWAWLSATTDAQPWQLSRILSFFLLLNIGASKELWDIARYLCGAATPPQPPSHAEVLRNTPRKGEP